MPDTSDAASQTLMFAEARESADAVARLLASSRETIARLADRLGSQPPASVVTLARGSSDNATTYGRYLIENTIGIPCASVGLSVGSIYEASAKASGSLCICVSQSGASPDLLSAVARAKKGGALVVGMINQPNSPLAELCDEVIALAAGPERSVAATKSFISSLAAFAWLVAEWADDRELLGGVMDLPAQLERAWTQDWSEIERVLRQAVNLFVIGRGPGLGVAQEAALKLKETSGLHAEALSAAEIAHGPMALVGPSFPVLAFSQADASLATSRATAEGLAARSATVLLAGAEAVGATSLPTIRAHPALEPLLMVQSFYRAAANLSIARKRDPDNPPHLAKVTRTL
jgi:glucosamine--fructose-6-phosphate aminotransferase (isomerizing)